MKLFAILVDCIKPLTIFAKRPILGNLQGYEYACNKNPRALSFISQKIRTAISADWFHF